MTVLKPNRKDKRNIAFETKRNEARIKALERKFAVEITSIDDSSQDFIANLEDTVYNDIYKKFQAKFVHLIESMERSGCYKYTAPNPMYFRLLYNPIDGTKITVTE